MINNSIGLFTDIQTLQEAITFVYDDNGRPDAMEGRHDDLLFSDMIANEIRTQQRFTVETGKEKSRYEADMEALLSYGG